MPFVIFRVDNRLVHGQVFTWISKLKLNLVIVANDRVCEDLIQQSLIMLATETVFQKSVKVIFTRICEAVSKLEQEEFLNCRILLLVDSLQDALLLIDSGLKVNSINIGGLYNQEGKNKVEYTPSLFLNKEDIQIIETLIKRNILVSPEPLPDDSKIDILKLIRR